MSEENVMSKWSDYTFDVCPFCGGNMGIFAASYAFQLCFILCQHCSEQSQSAYVYDEGTTFQWIIPDEERNKSYMEAYKRVAAICNPLPECELSKAATWQT